MCLILQKCLPYLLEIEISIDDWIEMFSVISVYIKHAQKYKIQSKNSTPPPTNFCYPKRPHREFFYVLKTVFRYLYPLQRYARIFVFRFFTVKASLMTYCTSNLQKEILRQRQKFLLKLFLWN